MISAFDVIIELSCIFLPIVQCLAKVCVISHLFFFLPEFIFCLLSRCFHVNHSYLTGSFSWNIIYRISRIHENWLHFLIRSLFISDSKKKNLKRWNIFKNLVKSDIAALHIQPIQPIRNSQKFGNKGKKYDLLSFFENTLLQFYFSLFSVENNR